MSTIDDIKQIVMGNEAVWPNDLHIGHYGDQIELIDCEFYEGNPAPAKLQPCIDELKTAYQQENRAYKQPAKKFGQRLFFFHCRNSPNIHADLLCILSSL